MVHFLNKEIHTENVLPDEYTVHILCMDDPERTAVFAEKYEAGTGDILLVTEAEDVFSDRHFIAFINAWMVRQYHPVKLLYHHPSVSWRKPLQACDCWSKGSDYQKMIESTRYLVNDLVFDEEGCIINQGMMKKVPFGWFNTMEKGCGWIAAYNLLKIAGMEMTMEQCIWELEKYGFLGEVMGQGIGSLCFWLRKKGLPVQMSMPGNQRALKCMMHSSCGILLYQHAHGAHYAAYEAEKNGKIHLYNAIYGRRDYTVNAEQFLKRETLFPFASVLYIEGNKND